MATIKDIADEVGISKTAVSRILNHKGSFSQDTILKVERVAKRLNYTSPGMQREAGDGRKTIAAVLPLGRPYYGMLASYLEEAAYNYGYSLLLSSSAYDSEEIDEFLAGLRERSISGLVFGSISACPDDLVSSGFPIVAVGHSLADNVPYIHADNFAAGQIAARHLIGRGVKKPLYISNYPDGLVADERYRGFCEELEKADVIAWPYILDKDSVKAEGTPEIITRMILDHPDADGIFAESQSLAISCLGIYSDLGYSIPDQVRLIGYGSGAINAYTMPRMTIVKENTSQIASEAVSVLADLIEKGSAARKDVSVSVSLEQRQTT